MRQLWVSLLLLAAVMAALAGLGRSVKTLTEETARDLPLAMAAADRGDWKEAEKLIKEAGERWSEAGDWLPLVENHHTIEEIGVLLEEAALRAEDRDPGECRAACRRAVRAMEALSAAERLTPGNLF